jgi:hypothetical protein
MDSMNDRIWRELISRAALLALSVLLLAGSAGLFYVCYLSLRGGPPAPAAHGIDPAWRLFAFAAAFACGGAALLKHTVLPARAE